MNQFVIRTAAHGVMDIPELGRVQVSARSIDGDLGVRILADRPETTTILLPHTEAMAAEVRVPGGSAVRVDVAKYDAGTSSHTGGSSERDGRPQGREPIEVIDVDATEAPHPIARPRVRIVL
jgi:hypothetical protein